MGIARSFGAVMASAGLVVGLGGVAGATSATIGTTGPYSYNKINTTSYTRGWFANENNVPVHATNVQSAVTGNANASFNTSGGSAMTGEARNQNNTDTTATIRNNGAGGVVNGWWAPTSDDSVINMNMTGPSSHNYVNVSHKNSLSVTNTNNIPVTTVNTQTAVSGSANVSGNTYGGSAISGSATNTNTQTVSINVAN